MKYNVSETDMPIEFAEGRLFGKAFSPEGKQGKLKAVILSHGYNSSWRAVSDMAHALAECGVFAYCYDFRGGSVGSESSGSSLDMSVTSEMTDLKQAIEAVKSLENIDRENIFLYGESQGGFVTALTADDSIKGLYLLYPAFCIPDDWGSRQIKDSIILMGMHISKKFCEGLPKYDVYEHIWKYNGRVRIFHGDADGLVALSYSERAAECFKNASLKVFPGEGHGFSPEARKELIEDVCAEFKQL